MNVRVSNRVRSSMLCALGMTMILWSTVAVAQQLPTGIDTQSIRLAGARSQGALLTPSARLLEKHSWDFSLSYGFEHAVLRSTVLTGEVRGQNQRETIPWLNQRHSAYAQFAIAPSDRVELFVGMPILISQTGRAGTAVAAAPSGSAAMGDVRLGARVSVFNERSAMASWNLEAAAIVPSGDPGLLFGEERTRYAIGTSVGVPIAEKFRVDARLAHESGHMDMIGNQILGDTLIAQAAFSHHIDPSFRWFAELSNVNVISSSPAGTSPKRNALEVDVGARYETSSVYVDAGIGYGVLDAGYTPQVRAMVSVGTTGRWGKRKSDDDVNIQTCSDVCPETMAALRVMLHETLGQIPATDARCVLPPDDYKGALDTNGCIDFNNPDAAKEFQQRSLAETKVYFDLNRSELTPTGQNTVRQVVLILMHNEGSVRIIGHADDQGTDVLNDRLSRDRAEEVAKAIIAAGVSVDRIRIEFEGSKLPISPDTDFGRSINRRVDFQWVE